MEFTIFKNLAKWLFPVQIIQQNPEIPIYLFMICVGMGFIILNYKYVINTYNKTYEGLSYLTKIVLALSVGFIISFTSLVLLVISNTISNLFFNYDLIGNIWIGVIYLISSLIIGFSYFGRLRMIRDQSNPFYDIKEFFSFLVGLIFIFAFSFIILLLYHGIFVLDPKTGIYSYWIYANKIFWGVVAIYFICKMTDSSYEQYEREYNTKLIFHDLVESYIQSIERKYNKIKKFLRFIKSKIVRCIR